MMETVQEWLSLLGPNRYVQATATVVVAIIAAKTADWVICGLISRWARRTKTEFDDRLIAALHRPLFVSVLVVGLVIATRRLELSETVTWATLAMLKTIVLLIWLVFSIRFVGLILGTLSKYDRFPLVQTRTLPLLNNVSVVVLVGGAVYFLFLSWNIDVTAWLASAGIVGIALGFAAKDTLGNLFAGVFILVDAPYKVGDFVILDSGERGRVTQIGLRSTRLLTRDDVEITIPNAVMGNTKIINETGGPHEKERIRVRVGVAYGSDIDKVRSVLEDIAQQHPEICSDPEPRVRFRIFGDSGLEFELLAWIAEPVLRGRMLDALNCDVYKRFTQEGIEIPYPKRDVYIRQMSHPS